MMDLHTMNRDNKYVVFDSESLVLFSVTAEVGKILELFESEPVDSNLKLRVLDDTNICIDDLLKYFADLRTANSSKDPKWIDKEPKTLCLIISQDCNLKCAYCFADHGTFRSEKKLMHADTAKKCINMFFNNHKNIENFVLFYGGEPFLNFTLMKAIEEYGRSLGLNINYTTITNGTIMNDTIEKFVIDYFFKLYISLDGPKEINDIQRFGNVESVHDKVITTINRCKSNNIPLALKCIATNKSINKLTDIAEYLSSLSVDSIAFAEVSRIPPESEFFISDNDFENYANELSRILLKNLGQLAIGNKTVIINPIFNILRQLMTRTRAINNCSAGREYIAVTADGDVYPCHGFVGMEEFKMGNVHDEDFPGEAYNKIKKIFDTHSVHTSEECSSCWARFLCGGDCVVNSYLSNGELFHPTKRRCILIKSILEALLPEIADIFQDEVKTQNILNSIQCIGALNKPINSWSCR